MNRSNNAVLGSPAISAPFQPARVISLVAALLCLWLFTPAPAVGAGNLEESVEDSTEALEESTRDRKSKGWIFMPIPIANPTIDQGLAVTAMKMFKTDAESPASAAGGGAFWTNNDSWGGGLFTKLHLDADRIRVTGAVGHADLNLQFWGIGNFEGDSLSRVKINQKGEFAFAQSLWRVGSNVYLGPRYRGLQITSSLRVGPPDGFEDIGQLIFDGLTIVSSGLGAKLEWDTRDNPWGPSSGHFFEVSVDTSMDLLGGDRNYEIFNAAWNQFFPVGDRDVVGYQVAGCQASDDAPFYDICLIGSDKTLRGYPNGRYRDQRMISAQAEYRKHIKGRWGMVFFAGLGQVAENWGDLDFDNIRPSAGLGVRWVASEEHGVNVSVDVARGEDDTAFYFYIGEAF